MQTDLPKTSFMNREDAKEILWGFIFAFGYGLLFYILQFTFAKAGIFGNIPSAENIKYWDASFYESIKNNGYDPNSVNPGFFPLFAWVWQFSHLGSWGISFLNIAFFSLGFGVLVHTLEEKNKTFWLLCLTVPAVYYAFVPLSEALFFMVASITFWSIKKNSFWGTFISLFILSAIRSVGIFLLPAFLVMVFFSRPFAEFGKSLKIYLLRYAAPMLLSFGLVILYQYWVTDVWMIYFKTQASVFDKGFNWPKFPLSNIEGGMVRYGWLNASSILAGFTGLVWLIRKLVGWLKNKTEDNKLLTASMGYLAVVFMTILFLNPQYGTTQIMGANRYILITPFFFVFIHHFFTKEINVKKVWIFFLVLHVFWLLFTPYSGLRKFSFIVLPADLIILAFCYARLNKKYEWGYLAIIAFNFLMQMQYFQQFIQPLFTD